MSEYIPTTEDERNRWMLSSSIDPNETTLLCCRLIAQVDSLESAMAEARGILEKVADMERSDSFGVHGSDFLHCEYCQCGTKPGKHQKLEHEDDCIVPTAAAWLEKQGALP